MRSFHWRVTVAKLELLSVATFTNSDGLFLRRALISAALLAPLVVSSHTARQGRCGLLTPDSAP